MLLFIQFKVKPWDKKHRQKTITEIELLWKKHKPYIGLLMQFKQRTISKYSFSFCILFKTHSAS